jgi:predicted RNA binding protein YcfA (HicA-like mRNA interferase family)
VSKLEKVLEKILRGTSDANIGFDGLRQLLKNAGFDERIRGSHHIYTKSDVIEIINLQPKGSKAKAYQVKQVRNLILKYKLAGDVHD